MTRVKKNKFFAIHNIACTDEVLYKYKAGWTLSEIKEWNEFVAKNYKAEVKAFRKNK